MEGHMRHVALVALLTALVTGCSMTPSADVATPETTPPAPGVPLEPSREPRASGGATPNPLPPDGPIAFSADGELFTIEPDGAGLRQLTSTPEVWEVAPVWSNARTRIAYFEEPRTSHRWNEPGRALAVVSLDGTLVARLRPTHDVEVPMQPPSQAHFGPDPSWRRALWAKDDSTLTIQVWAENEVAAFGLGPHEYLAYVPLSFPVNGAPEQLVMSERMPTSPALIRDPSRGAQGVCSLQRFDHPDSAGGASCFRCEGPAMYRTNCLERMNLQALVPDACVIRSMAPCVTLDLADLDILPHSPEELWAYTLVPVGVIVAPAASPDITLVARGARMPRWSPNGDRLAYIREDGIYVKVLGEETETRIYQGKVDSLDW